MIDFGEATFKSKTSFEDVRFCSHVPAFYAAELYDDTTFPIPNRPEDNWPPQSGENIMPAEDQKRAYSRLRLFFAKSQQIDEEQFFHRQEMRCKRQMAEDDRKAVRWLYRLYACCADYGISIKRPFFALLGLWFFPFLIMAGYLCMYDLAFGWRELLGTSAGWSVANTLPFTGFARTYVGYDFYACLPPGLKFLGGLQTFLSYPLVFLFGLGLRNTFRLR